LYVLCVAGCLQTGRITPSAALVIATLANSGVPLGGKIDLNNDQSTYVPLDQIYPALIFQVRFRCCNSVYS
jgi:hypothetical protein